MKEYKCEDCDKIFDRKSNYINHKNRKNACGEKILKNNKDEEFNIEQYNINLTQDEIDALNNFNVDSKKMQECAKKCECAFCGKKYSNKSNVIFHIKNNCEKMQKITEAKDKVIKLKNEEEKIKLKQKETENKKLKFLEEELLELRKTEKETIKENKKLKEEILNLKNGYFELKTEFLNMKKELVDDRFNKLKYNFIETKEIKKSLDPVESSFSIVENVENVEKTTKSKKKIPPNFRMLVWDKNIGLDKGKHLCLCCKKREISQMDFHCGHIISEAKGGKLHIDNFLPICAVCNYSMGSENLYDHQQKLENFES
jgi:hypothetical protein